VADYVGVTTDVPSSTGPAERRRVDGFLLLLVALVLCGLAVAGLRVSRTFEKAELPLSAMLVLGGLLGGWALKRLEPTLPEVPPAELPPLGRTGAQLRWGVVCVALALALTGFGCVKIYQNAALWRLTLALWLFSLLLLLLSGFLLGRLGADGRTVAVPGPADEEMPRSLERFLFVAILLIGLFLRVYRIGSIPPGLFVDETNGALDAVKIVEGANVSFFHTGWYGTPNGYFYFLAGLIRLFGTTILSLKLASLLPALLTLPALYALGRLLFGPTAGLIAMFLLAVSRWHLTMSRWGWAEVAPPLFQVLATYLLLRGLKERRARDFVVGGLLTGWMLYIYLSSRLALATLVLFIAYWLFTYGGGAVAAIRRAGSGLALFFAAFAITFAPLATTYVQDPNSFFLRMKEVNVLNEMKASGSYKPLLLNLRDHARMFHSLGDGNGRHNLPREPQTDPVTGVLFVVGLGYALLRPGDPRRGLLLLWVLFAMSGGFLSQHSESPQSFRTLTVVPAIALLSGDVLSRFSRAAAQRTASRRRLTAAAAALIVVPCAAAGVWEARVYFGPQASSDAVRASFHVAETETAAVIMRDLRAGKWVALSERDYWFSVIRYLAYGAGRAPGEPARLDQPAFHQIRLDADLPLPDPGKDVVLIVELAYQSVMDSLRAYYPEARLTVLRSSHGDPTYLRVDISRAQMARLMGLNGRFVRTNGTAVELVTPTPDPPVDLGPLRAARWSGGLRIEKSGPYALVHLDGRLVSIDGESLTGERFLSKGLHDLTVEQTEFKTPLLPLAWKTSSADEETIPRSSFFRITVPPHGLSAEFWANGEWTGEPLFRQRVPFVCLAWPGDEPVPAPFSARFFGSLRIPAEGNYRLRIEADDAATLMIDGWRLDGPVGAPPKPYIERSVELTKGDHALRIDYVQTGGGNALRFFWQRGQQPEELVPPSALLP
jgi:hypothetical protein